MPKPPSWYATRANKALERLAAGGDARAAVELRDRGYVQLLAGQPNLTPEAKVLADKVLTGGLWALWLENLFVQFRKTKDGPVEMWLRIDDGITIEQLKSPAIRAWRDRLSSMQPHEDGWDAYLSNLDQANKAGKGYGRIARDLNEEFTADLTRFYEYQTEDLWRLALFTLQHNLQVFIRRPARRKCINQLLAHARHNLQEGRRPFGHDQPLTHVDVREALRAWRKKYPSHTS